MLFPSGEITIIIALSFAVGKPARGRLFLAILEGPQTGI
jgi:hypothetical protein